MFHQVYVQSLAAALAKEQPRLLREHESELFHVRLGEKVLKNILEMCENFGRPITLEALPKRIQSWVRKETMKYFSPSPVNTDTEVNSVDLVSLFGPIPKPQRVSILHSR